MFFIAAFSLFMWKKVFHYLKRYGLAELAGGAFVLLISSLVYHFTRNKIAAAYAGTIGENIGFYGMIIGGDIIAAKKRSENWNWKHVAPVLKNVLVEFGGAEFLDSLVVRPGLLYLGTSLIKKYQLGALAGVVAADIVFYAMAVLSSELLQRKKGKNP